MNLGYVLYTDHLLFDVSLICMITSPTLPTSMLLRVC